MNAAEIADDRQFEEHRIGKVTPGKDGWTMAFEEGCCFWCPDHGIEPKAGDIARCYGKGFGYTVRGLTINGQVVFYRTEAQEAAHQAMEQAERDRRDREEFERNRADRDERIAALPKPLRQRIERYQAASPDFRWKYEGYELFVCEQAALIAAAFRDLGLDDAAPHVRAEVFGARIAAFKELPWEQQVATVPGLDDGHSGNTFGAACHLALRLLIDRECVKGMPAAISPLVGQVGDKIGA